jgi:hypothetical protein
MVRTISPIKPDLLPQLQALLANAPPELCADPTQDEVVAARNLINTADAPILAAAVKSRADCIVSGNTRHFTQRVARRAGIAIYTPAAYVGQLR